MTDFSLKDQLFSRPKVVYLAELIAAQSSSFDKESFVAGVMTQLLSLELKQRIAWIAQQLADHLPKDYPKAVRLVLKCLPPPLDESKTDDDFGDFILTPLGEFVVRHGLSQLHLGLSLAALKEITKRFSMEDAVRAFVRKYPQETLAELTLWATDANYHVRRVVSESTRPLLPWSGRIGLPPETALPLLDVLHADRTRYVTRSVANHLNDIAKTNPDLVVNTLRAWHSQAKQDPKELMWMTRHALRTLIKRGHGEALKLLGYRPAPKLSIGELSIKNDKLKPGESLEFCLEITALRDESLVIDYTIDFVKAGGKRSAKIFKAAKMVLKKGESQFVRKKHKLHAAATTYRLYSGEHRLSVQVNGQTVRQSNFVIE